MGTYSRYLSHPFGSVTCTDGIEHIYPLPRPVPLLFFMTATMTSYFQFSAASHSLRTSANKHTRMPSALSGNGWSGAEEPQRRTAPHHNPTQPGLELHRIEHNLKI